MGEELPGTETIDSTFDRFGIGATVGAVLMIVFGVLVIAFPELIAWLVGGYLLIAGVVKLADELSTEPSEA